MRAIYSIAFTALCAVFLSSCAAFTAMTASSGQGQDDGIVTVRELRLSAAALNDYQGAYALDQPNKAFAISPDGAFAAAHSFPTQSLAAATALIQCNERVRIGEAECFVYDANGVIVAHPPFQLTVKSF